MHLHDSVTVFYDFAVLIVLSILKMTDRVGTYQPLASGQG